MDPLTVTVVTILGKYAIDKGVELGRAVGPQALDTAKEIFKMVLERVKKEEPRTAEKFPENPEGYQAPMQDVLEETVESDREFAAQLRRLVEEYKAAKASYQSDSGTSYEAKLKGSGAIAQGAGASATGERGVSVGGDVTGPIVTGDKGEVE
jgi:hypothetical protein